jgi:glycerol-3-phosphate responsive antiterminator
VVRPQHQQIVIAPGAANRQARTLVHTEEAAAFALLPGIAPAQLREIRVKCNTVPLIAVGGELTFQ